jgi:aldose 1-epimerase
MAALAGCYDNRMNDLLALTSRRYTAGIAPGLGGSLLYFATRREPQVDFVRPTPARALVERNVRATASYPLVPYSNRIGDGRFHFDGTEVVLARTNDVSSHPIHGVGWQRPWQVESADDARIVLKLSHAPAGRSDPAWPWAFDATQVFELDDLQLRWRIELHNRDSRSMPAGLGMHPFFPKSPRMAVRFAAEGVWRNDERMLPTSRTAVPREWDYGAARPVADLAVDNCFAGWSHEADIVWPDLGWRLTLSADPIFGHLVVFTSPARTSVAIEPVTHANNAVNLSRDLDDTGMQRLQPGSSLAGAVALTPCPVEQADAR